MKLFRTSRGAFKGILQYIYDKDRSSLSATSTNQNKDPLILFESPNQTVFYFDADISVDSFVQFDVGAKYSFTVTDYQTTTSPGSTPPMNWTITATNNLNGEWVMIDSQAEFKESCARSGETQCIERKTTFFKINYVVAAFRYYRFNLLSCLGNSHCLRLGGIDFFGYLYKTRELYHQMTCHISHSFNCKIISFVCMIS